MASITNPTPLDNNSANSGTGIQTKIQTLYDNDSAINAELVTKAQIINGTGHAPAGTQVKMSWFEGTLNISGSIQFNHGLGNNILAIKGYYTDVSGLSIEFSDLNAYDSNQITLSDPSADNLPYRCLVFHK